MRTIQAYRRLANHFPHPPGGRCGNLYHLGLARPTVPSAGGEALRPVVVTVIRYLDTAKARTLEFSASV